MHSWFDINLLYLSQINVSDISICLDVAVFCHLLVNDLVNYLLYTVNICLNLSAQFTNKQQASTYFWNALHVNKLEGLWTSCGDGNQFHYSSNPIYLSFTYNPAAISVLALSCTWRFSSNVSIHCNSIDSSYVLNRIYHSVYFNHPIIWGFLDKFNFPDGNWIWWHWIMRHILIWCGYVFVWWWRLVGLWVSWVLRCRSIKQEALMVLDCLLNCIIPHEEIVWERT